MGVTISSGRTSFDLGYFGFAKLRKKVAELAGHDIYKQCVKLYLPYREMAEIGLDSFDEEVEQISRRYDGKMDGILNFLFASDCGASISVEDCRCLYKIIKKYDDNVCYGYAGRKDCFMFRDFKSLVHECIKSGRPLTWY